MTRVGAVLRNPNSKLGVSSSTLSDALKITAREQALLQPPFRSEKVHKKLLQQHRQYWRKRERSGERPMLFSELAKRPPSSSNWRMKINVFTAKFSYFASKNFHIQKVSFRFATTAEKEKQFQKLRFLIRNKKFEQHDAFLRCSFQLF